MHGDARVPELQHLADGASLTRGCPAEARRARLERALSLLQLLEAGPEDVREVRGALHGARRVRHRTRRGRDPEAVSDGARRARRSRHGAAEGQPRRDPREGRQPRGRHPDRHADDREGPRLSGGDAGRRDLRRRRSRPRRFPRQRAHVSAADAGRRPRRPRRASRRGHHPVAAAEALQRSRWRATQDYRAFYDKEIKYRRAMRYPPQVAMVNVVVRGETFDEAMDGAARSRRCRARRRRAS